MKGQVGGFQNPGVCLQAFPYSTKGAKEERVDENFFRGAGMLGNFLFNFSKVTGNTFITIKLLIFSTSSAMLLSGLKIHHH